MEAQVSFIIPCYNEEGNVEAVYEAVHRVFDPEGISVELVMINDGSRDGTREKLKALYEKDGGRSLKVIGFSRNFGKEAAVLAGLRASRGVLTCFIDADLQHNPKVALEMYRRLQAEPDTDCVAACQRERTDGKVLTFFKKSFYKVINAICDIPFVSGAGDFRMFRQNVRDALLSLTEYNRFSKGLFPFVGFNTVYIPFDAEERHSGTTKWSFRKLFRYAVEGITGYTTEPLRLPAGLGTVMTLLSVLFLIVLLIRKLGGTGASPAAVVTGFLFLLSGINLIMLGIIGEYLARTYTEGKKRPVYIIKEILSEESYGEDKTD